MQAELDAKAAENAVVQGYVELSRAERLAASQLWAQKDTKKVRANLGETWAARQQVKVDRAMESFVVEDRDERRRRRERREAEEAAAKSARANALANKAKEKSMRHWDVCRETV